MQIKWYEPEVDLTLVKGGGQKVNIDKNKMRVIDKESPKYKIMLKAVNLEEVSEFKHQAIMLDKQGMNNAECRKVLGSREVAGFDEGILLPI